jgi:hypothetical protein
VPSSTRKRKRIHLSSSEPVELDVEDEDEDEDEIQHFRRVQIVHQRFVRKGLSLNVSINPLQGTTDGELVNSSDIQLSTKRSRLRQNVPTYNLKTLAALAQGKSPRTLRPASSRGRDDGLTVFYCFAKVGDIHDGPKQEVTVLGLGCPFCNSQNNSVDELHLHLQNKHEDGAFKFHLRRYSSPHFSFFVQDLSKSRVKTDLLKIVQFGVVKISR